MIVQLWAYAIVIGILLALAGVMADGLAATVRLPRRWSWALLLLVTLALSTVSPWLPSLRSDAAGSTWTVRVVGAVSGSVAAVGDPDSSWLNRAAGGIWALGTLALAGVYLAGRVELHRRRRAWVEATVLGIPVLLARDLGPAVVGCLESRIVLPEWALPFADPSLRLMLAHEREHQRAGDPLLLHTAGFAVAAMPWNPAAWWMFSRLKLAIELDCDSRVLASSTSMDADRARVVYSELLLTVARSRPAHHLLVMPAMLERASRVARRISAMHLDPPRFVGIRNAAALMATVAFIVLAACVPAPTTNTPAGGSGGRGPDVRELDPVRPGPGVTWPRPLKQVAPEYTREAMDQRIEGEVHLSAVVEPDGRVDRIRVVQSLDSKHGLDEAAVEATKKWAFAPCTKDGKPVACTIEMVLEYRLK